MPAFPLSNAIGTHNSIPESISKAVKITRGLVQFPIQMIQVRADAGTKGYSISARLFHTEPCIIDQ